MTGIEFLVFFVFALPMFLVVAAPSVLELMRGIPGAEKVHIMVGGKRVECRVIADRWWYDTIEVNTAISYDFFLTLTGKTKAYADFEGDKSLVKEREYALIYGAVSYIMIGAHTGYLDAPDILALYDNASYEWKQSDVTVSEDRMKVLAGGVSSRVSGLAAAAGEVQPGDGRHDNMRWFKKPMLILGGRSVDFRVTLGTAMSAAKDLQIAFYGLHLIPTRILPAG